MSTPDSLIPLLLFFLSLYTPKLALAIVTDSQTFTFINEGEFGPYITEYGASYCLLSRAATRTNKCGSFGVCEEEMCVGCPKPQWLLGWSKNCEPPKLRSCKGSVDY
ncbi:epidermis-specific secreted glycoprotein EP1-like [Tasmannia lanceolata]|uniref:epidermis-specific secreted glycoprotein EP1-like n=1 Tax=Tasmannia lanceolata TaxID=3420 RepID=UPI004062C3CE